jgi:sulfide-dependent adenosine diphosphate thiazole synthase
LAEKGNVAHTGEIFPGPLTAGMNVKALHGLTPKDPGFGGMLLSGKKAAE